jgi:hypothetical protein
VTNGLKNTTDSAGRRDSVVKVVQVADSGAKPAVHAGTVGKGAPEAGSAGKGGKGGKGGGTTKANVTPPKKKDATLTKEGLVKDTPYRKIDTGYGRADVLYRRADTVYGKKDTGHQSKDTAKLSADSALPETEHPLLKCLFPIAILLLGFLFLLWVVTAAVLLRMTGVAKKMVREAPVAAPLVAAPLVDVALVDVAIAPVAETVPSVDVAETPFFVCELMMTAGPRKKFMNEGEADKDLGEDVCGCVINNNKLGVWLLDGTSDQHCLRHPVTGEEYFSSRLLAQHIGDNLRKAFVMKGGGAPLADMMDKAIQEVRIDWVRTINGLPENEKQALTQNILVKNFPECSSTLLSARLDLNGELEAYRSGDSKMLFFKNGQVGLIPAAASFATKHPESNDRIFFRIISGPEGQLDIICNKPLYELTRQEHIQDLIGFSDGIGSFTEEALKEDYQEDPDTVRRRIIAHVQGTADDKSICFVRIK